MEYLEIVTDGRDVLNILKFPRHKLDNLWWQVVIHRTTIDFVQTINCKHKDHPRCFQSCANLTKYGGTC